MERCGCYNVVVFTRYVDFDNNKKHSYKTMQQILSITSVKLHENKKYNKQNDEKKKINKIKYKMYENIW